MIISYISYIIQYFYWHDDVVYITLQNLLPSPEQSSSLSMHDDKDNNLMMNDQIDDDDICDYSFSMMVMITDD